MEGVNVEASAFEKAAEPEGPVKTSMVRLKNGDEFEARHRFSSVIGYAKKAAAGSGDDGPYVVVEVANTDPVIRRGFHYGELASVTEIK